MSETAPASALGEEQASLQQRLVSEHPQWWLGAMPLGLHAAFAWGIQGGWWLGAMLLALHAALAWGIEEWWSRAFLLAHLGLFLIWQPVWRGERELKTS